MNQPAGSLNQPAGSLLHERNSQLHNSGQVEFAAEQARAQGERVPNQPVAKIGAYIGNLTRHSLVAEIAADDPQASQLLKRRQRQIEARIIAMTPENAHAFTKFEAKIARQEGAGFDPDTAPEDMKMERLRIQREDQRKQLTEWVDYLTGADTDYPAWFTYYTLDAITSLTKFDEAKQKFGKRSEGSFALFPELDRESLSTAFDALNGQLEGKPIELPNADPAVQEAIRAAAQSGNFAKLYTEASKLGFAITPELRKNLHGHWQRYEQSTDQAQSDVLASDIARYRTGWCTAGHETAHTQLSQGDFYVFYTEGASGQQNVPRVAIRMEDGKVREVRGINASQNMEPELGGVVLEQVKTLPGGEEYVRKAEDMRQLTALEKKLTADPNIELTSQELRFLYQVDRDIEGFGYKKDPRIDELRTLRSERDKLELIRIMPEAVREQLTSAYTAYEAVTSFLGEASASPEELSKLFAEAEKDWQEHGVYDFIVEELINRGVRYNLVATPNVLADGEQIMALARTFCKQQPFQKTYIYDQLYQAYSAEELSGRPGKGAARFSLIPSGIDEELSSRATPAQVDLLRQRQARQPLLGIKVPSVLESVTHWFTLRAQGDKLADASAFDNKTFIRHFDLEPKELDGSARVPWSYVDYGGWVGLDYSPADDDGNARLAVGHNP